MIITRKLKLYIPNSEKEQVLDDTTKRFKKCVNFYVRRIREEESTNLKLLQSKYYFRARRYARLGGAITQDAQQMAIQIARRAKRKRKVSPLLKSDVILTHRLKVDGNKLGITFGKGRFWVPFKSQEIPEGKIKTSSLKRIDGRWYCNLSIEVPDPKPKTYKKILGVDLGIAKTATISDANGKHVKFFRGEPLRFKKNHYHRLRAELQSKKKYRALKRIKRKESNWVKDMNHKISRQIVNYAAQHKHGIAFENLTGITERLKVNKKTRKMLKGWSFHQLAMFISYKARLAGLPDVLVVDPRGTSKTCPKCDFSAKVNRKTQSRFVCKRCSYESNADRIGSMNIARRATGLMASPLDHGQQAPALTSA